MAAAMDVARRDRKSLHRRCLGPRKPVEPAERRSALQRVRETESDRSWQTAGNSAGNNASGCQLAARCDAGFTTYGCASIGDQSVRSAISSSVVGGTRGETGLPDQSDNGPS